MFILKILNILCKSDQKYTANELLKTKIETFPTQPTKIPKYTFRLHFETSTDPGPVVTKTVSDVPFDTLFILNCSKFSQKWLHDVR